MHQRQAGAHADVGADAVNGEVVGVGALAVDAELSLLVEAGPGENNTWRQFKQRLKTSAIERQVLDEVTVDNRTGRGGLLNA